jgi:hypothetical protein
MFPKVFLKECCLFRNLFGFLSIHDAVIVDFAVFTKDLKVIHVFTLGELQIFPLLS